MGDVFMETVTIEFELTEQEALALAQFVKRLGWQEIRINAVDDDEAYCMRDAIAHVRFALSRQGFSPR
jgi:hypothetical protein